MIQPIFTMLIGMPASGKSTWCKQNLDKKCVYINPDSIRLQEFHVQFDARIEPEVWSLVKQRISLALKGKKNCVLDATNLKREHRNDILKIAHKEYAFTLAIVFHTHVLKCLWRDSHRTMRVGRDVLKMMWKNWRYFKKHEYKLLTKDFSAVMDVK